MCVTGKPPIAITSISGSDNTFTIYIILLQNTPSTIWQTRLAFKLPLEVYSGLHCLCEDTMCNMQIPDKIFFFPELFFKPLL